MLLTKTSYFSNVITDCTSAEFVPCKMSDPSEKIIADTSARSGALAAAKSAPNVHFTPSYPEAKAEHLIPLTTCTSLDVQRAINSTNPNLDALENRSRARSIRFGSLDVKCHGSGTGTGTGAGLTPRDVDTPLRKRSILKTSSKGSASSPTGRNLRVEVLSLWL